MVYLDWIVLLLRSVGGQRDCVSVWKYGQIDGVYSVSGPSHSLNFFQGVWIYARGCKHSYKCGWMLMKISIAVRILYIAQIKSNFRTGIPENTIFRTLRERHRIAGGEENAIVPTYLIPSVTLNSLVYSPGRAQFKLHDCRG